MTFLAFIAGTTSMTTDAMKQIARARNATTNALAAPVTITAIGRGKKMTKYDQGKTIWWFVS